MAYIGWIIILIGALFLFLGGLGIFRMPDVLNQAQAGTKTTTLGIVSLLAGMIFLHPVWGFKLIIIALFFLATSPIGSHSIARAALKRKKENFVLTSNAYENGGSE
jgi:multicomponent Na+:H+ antiporter subunit G